MLLKEKTGKKASTSRSGAERAFASIVTITESIIPDFRAKYDRLWNGRAPSDIDECSKALAISRLELPEAARSGDLTKVKRLLFEICISVNTTGKNFVTPLIAATMNGHIEVVKFLLNFPFGEKLNVNALSDFGTALMYAGSTGDIVIVRELLAHDADVNARDQRGRTALMMAALTGQYGVVDLLLYNGADINVKDERGMTALDKALYKGHKEVAQLLRDHGAIESSD